MADKMYLLFRKAEKSIQQVPLSRGISCRAGLRAARAVAQAAGSAVAAKSVLATTSAARPLPAEKNNGDAHHWTAVQLRVRKFSFEISA